MTQIILKGHSKESSRENLEEAISMCKRLTSVSSRTHNTQGGKNPDGILLALIIDGPTLVHILETELEEEVNIHHSMVSVEAVLYSFPHFFIDCFFASLNWMVQLFKVATTCDVVLCCRVAPLQKAGIVALMKKRTNDMTFYWRW